MRVLQEWIEMLLSLENDLSDQFIASPESEVKANKEKFAAQLKALQPVIATCIARLKKNDFTASDSQLVGQFSKYKSHLEAIKNTSVTKYLSQLSELQNFLHKISTQQ